MIRHSIRSAAALLLCLLFLCGCAAPAADPAGTPQADPTAAPAPTPAASDPQPPFGEFLPLQLAFSGGAGAWSSVMQLQPDLSFTAVYSDTDLGSMGEDYPNGTQYICNFSGQFSLQSALDEHRFALTLTRLTSDYEEGKEWIEDGVRYVSSIPYGMESGTEFVLCLPQTPLELLPEALLDWWPGRFAPEEDQSGMLDFFCLHNLTSDYGFFG